MYFTDTNAYYSLNVNTYCSLFVIISLFFNFYLLDWSYDVDEEDFTESHSINENVDGGSTKLQLELCNSCSKSLPIGKKSMP